MGSMNSLTDCGAQYITQCGASAISEHAEIYEELRGAGLLKPMQGRIEGSRAADGDGCSFVCPDGLSRLVAHLLDKSGVFAQTNQRAVRLQRAPSGAPRWLVT